MQEIIKYPRCIFCGNPVRIQESIITKQKRYYVDCGADLDCYQDWMQLLRKEDLYCSLCLYPKLLGMIRDPKGECASVYLNMCLNPTCTSHKTKVKNNALIIQSHCLFAEVNRFTFRIRKLSIWLIELSKREMQCSKFSILRQYIKNITKENNKVNC